jgi:hypothetical protein
MMRKLSTWLVVASAGGLLIAGCGSSSGTSTTSTQTAPAAATTSPTTATNAPAGATSSPATAKNAPAGATGTTGARPGSKTLQSVATCKQAINAQRTLPASAKVKLETVCEKFAATTSPTTSATGSVTALSKAARAACVRLLSHLPAGAARERAVAGCKAE